MRGLLLRLRWLGRRALRFSPARIHQFASQAQKLSRAPRWVVVIDMLWCIVRYECTFENYAEWDFRILSRRERATYMTDPKSANLAKTVNSQITRGIFDDKSRFAESFEPWLGREWIDVRNADADALRAFVARHPRVITKDPDGVGGKNISVREIGEGDDVAALHAELLEGGDTLVESLLDQHEGMSALYPGSVNSLRLVTYADPEGRVHLLASVLKMGNGGVIDNFSNGGMYTMLDDEGVALHAATDEEGHVFERHPATDTPIAGFRVPLYDEVLRLVETLALHIPSMPYIGWDIAITPEGPVVIEGNHNSGVFQSKPSVSGIRTGLLPLYRAATGGLA